MASQKVDASRSESKPHAHSRSCTARATGARERYVRGPVGVFRGGGGGAVRGGGG